MYKIRREVRSVGFEYNNKSPKVALAIFDVRELGRNYPYFWQGIKHSKTGKDKKLQIFSSVKDIIKHKKIPVSPMVKTNLGQQFLMVCGLLDRVVWFPCLSGN